MIETDLVTLLKTACPRVYPDMAPITTIKPYVTFQGIGGTTLRYTEGTAPPQRFTLMQVNVWATTRLEANALMRQIENTLYAATTLVATADSEPLSLYEFDTLLYGSLQRFNLFGLR